MMQAKRNLAGRRLVPAACWAATMPHGTNGDGNYEVVCTAEHPCADTRPDLGDRCQGT